MGVYAFNMPILGDDIYISNGMHVCVRVCVCVCVRVHMHATLSCVWLFATSWTVACQAPLSMGFPRLEYWGGLPFPTPGDLPDPGIEPTSLVSPAQAGRFFITMPLGKPF